MKKKRFVIVHAVNPEGSSFMIIKVIELFDAAFSSHNVAYSGVIKN